MKGPGAAVDTTRSTGFYAPSLDGLRWFAVVAVMCSHFSPTLNALGDWGLVGVRLFFVLSGYLITLLLLRARESMSSAHLGAVFGQFLVRRIFRLWPLYFASLAVAFSFQLSGTETSVAWHAFFATNHYVHLHQHWPTLLSHYWTLAVEQQFYVVWPLAALWFPLHRLRPVLLSLALAGPLFRSLPFVLGQSRPELGSFLLPACVDFFAFGAGVAWLQRQERLPVLGERGRLRTMLGILVLWLLLDVLLKGTGRMPAAWIIFDASIQAAGFAALLGYLLLFPDSRLARVLAWAPFTYLGRISYGLYIWHNFAHRFGPSFLRRTTGNNYFADETTHVAYYIILTVVAASLSYHLLENPARRLGHRLASRLISGRHPGRANHASSP